MDAFDISHHNLCATVYASPIILRGQVETRRTPGGQKYTAVWYERVVIWPNVRVSKIPCNASWVSSIGHRADAKFVTHTNFLPVERTEKTLRLVIP